MNTRKSSIQRETRETSVSITLTLEGRGQAEIETGIGFLNHLLQSFTQHARIDLKVHTQGDLHVDDHHTVEDTFLALGQAIDRALGCRKGIQRFGYAYVPLDEALARVVIDFSGRGMAVLDLQLQRDQIGGLACENITHAIESLARASRATVHADILRGKNDHHKSEALFKALALAFRDAVALSGSQEIPSTKGTLV